MCACPPGETYCPGDCRGPAPEDCTGSCVDLKSDKQNCGACGATCSWGANATLYPLCEYGSCVFRCIEGFADCNGSAEDYCEVNTDTDPNNCGACGHACDVVAGQACVHGRCAVEPCDDQDAGGPQ
jgi:hypothetical protein